MLVCKHFLKGILGMLLGGLLGSAFAQEPGKEYLFQGSSRQIIVGSQSPNYVPSTDEGAFIPPGASSNASSSNVGAFWWARKRDSEVGGGRGDTLGSFYQAGNVSVALGYIGVTSEGFWHPEPGGYNGFEPVIEVNTYDFEYVDPAWPIDMTVKMYAPFMFKDNLFKYDLIVNLVFHIGFANSDIPFINMLDFHAGIGFGYSGYVNMDTSEQYDWAVAMSWDAGLDIFFPGYMGSFYVEARGLGNWDIALASGFRVIL